MGRIEWNNSLNIGIKEIDEQHQNLVQMINDILEAFAKGETESAVDRMLGQLHEYTVLHFNAEEKYMEKIEFPYLQSHRHAHARLKGSVKSLRAARFHYEEIPPEEIKELLSKWLIDHILHEDYKIVQFIKQGGTKDWSENIK
ncbi:bacteriohemerythrin [Maridesulfovibrio salexigens]|uniref:Hemerythrin-like metal-binding protein n=1 Tax=Maridesulfovibrio salexigens (strain ATCC 14822 / DSM 2638 / NCIMB 8403 / VKM B-1763) TaxID=526222 RepID=C6BSS3_MARSD|nr:hemerythrin family protein [Maridesulfovibrio salexigens]ACS81529.1 hemerythrin-like metal-binding protein [Maridesulfovibrio salexigens DSM 2638]